jgi:hypothetical protein
MFDSVLFQHLKKMAVNDQDAGMLLFYAPTAQSRVNPGIEGLCSHVASCLIEPTLSRLTMLFVRSRSSRREASTVSFLAPSKDSVAHIRRTSLS